MVLGFIDSLEVELTNHCNANCAFCPRAALTRPKGFMTRETFQTVVARAKELKVKSLLFSGFGEPLLHKEALEFIAYLNEQAPEISCELITNAALLTPAVVDRLKQLKVGQLVISFNGFDRDSYERSMLNLSYDTVIANLGYLAKAGSELLPKVKVRPVITKSFDTPELAKMKQGLTGLGFRPENLNESYLCANRGGYLINDEVYDAAFLQAKGVVPLPQADFICIMFVKTLQIAWDGEILLCCCDINNVARIGNIKDADLAAVEKKIVSYRSPGGKSEVCLRCNAPFVYKGYKKIK
jgi:uncharacterized Fe-S cluster-containing radical SAM superfamily protein